ncbi:patatin-like phospholipase family protein [Mesorhizobium sp. ES1-1]|uniref:patatin-like phospholipase family protein n=1 Tax=Mesorhizobium sp. ES1-1 TaxID=2876629 RepID=UPI001CCE59B6|nr:patatin-like phospholipase family protein [Mesorhizobium sp. ES1-1]MBZ9678247.1 patatin-like phospholipase family protein [Mesorhizobium sp. ES1-1]
MSDKGSEKFRILSLDGGGAKGFYSLGVLHELEAMLGGGPLCERFNLIYGTSTGAIIGTLLAVGKSVTEIHDLYAKYVPTVMKPWLPSAKTEKLAALANEIFGDMQFDAVRTGIGIVATNWAKERPMIFKAEPTQAHGRVASFVPGWGVRLADAVQASCSAYPFFLRKTITTSDGDTIELGDGGFCANNPSLYAIADAVEALGVRRSAIALISIGVGVYPSPKRAPLGPAWLANKLPSIQLLQKTLEINTQSMEQLRKVLFEDVGTVRISNTYHQPEMATDLLEHDLAKLNILRQRGRESFEEHEGRIRALLV